MLTDQSIDMVQKLLSDKFPDPDRLHGTVVGPLNTFPIVKTYKSMSQFCIPVDCTRYAQQIRQKSFRQLFVTFI